MIEPGAIAAEADLDPTTEAGCVRLRRLCDEGRVMHLEEVMRRAEAAAVDPELRVVAALVLGQWDLVRGELSRCEQRCLEAIAAARGRWPKVLGAAYCNYARLCLQVRRDLEALVLARRGVEACRTAGDPVGVAFGRMVEGYVLAGLDDWPRLHDVVRTVRREMTAVGPAVRPTLEYGHAALLARLALGEGRGADALDHIARAQALAEAIGEPSWSPREPDVVGAQAWALVGRDDEALRCIERGLETGPTSDADGLLLQALRLRLLVCGDAEGVEPAAERWLAELEAESAQRLSAGVLLHRARLGAVALVPACPALAARAYRVAARCTRLRLAEVARFVRGFPEVSMPTPAELRVLDDHRSRTEREERELRGALACYLPDEAGGPLC